MSAKGKTGKNSWDQLRRNLTWSPSRVWANFVGNGRFFGSRRNMFRISGFHNIPGARFEGEKLGAKRPTGSLEKM